MKPQFPEFKTMTFEDQEILEEYVSQFPPYSDYNFISLWVYNTENDIHFSFLNENVVIRFRDYVTNEHFYSFLGVHKLHHTIQTLLDWSTSHKLPARLKLIPGVVIQTDSTLKESFLVKEDSDNFDYILSTAKLRLLAGNEYKSKRRLVNSFFVKYPHHVQKEVDAKDGHIQEQMKALFHVWGKVRKKTQNDVAHELIALERLLRHANKFKLETVAVYVDDMMIGFSIVELTHDNYAINHFMKMDCTYTGVSEVLDKAVAEKLHERGYLHFNIEQDLGIGGLKKAKQLCKPTHFLKKYIIVPKGAL